MLGRGWWRRASGSRRRRAAVVHAGHAGHVFVHALALLVRLGPILLPLAVSLGWRDGRAVRFLTIARLQTLLRAGSHGARWRQRGRGTVVVLLLEVGTG
jgi:hypothetical protein